nr:MAG TPA: hypothetical protein [Caudoviricetes sp.]
MNTIRINTNSTNIKPAVKTNTETSKPSQYSLQRMLYGLTPNQKALAIEAGLMRREK